MFNDNQKIKLDNQTYMPTQNCVFKNQNLKQGMIFRNTSGDIFPHL